MLISFRRIGIQIHFKNFLVDIYSIYSIIDFINLISFKYAAASEEITGLVSEADPLDSRGQIFKFLGRARITKVFIVVLAMSLF
jgi:hypothetical protein